MSLNKVIDFVKLELYETNPKSFETNPLLDFNTNLNTNTGEISRKLIAKYRGLKIELYKYSEHKAMITIAGSLHKYYNDGLHNFNDFKLDDVVKIVNELNTKFNIRLERAKIRQIEIGVNILLPFEVNNFIDSCIIHKGRAFNEINLGYWAKYVQVKHNQYLIKLYNKYLQYSNKGYNVPKNLIRFEVKYNKTAPLKKYVSNQLGAFLTNAKEIIYNELLTKWEDVLFYNFKEFNNTEKHFLYSNYKYWKHLNNAKLKYHRKVNNRGNTDFYSFRDLLKQKIQELS